MKKAYVEFQKRLGLAVARGAGLVILCGAGLMLLPRSAAAAVPLSSDALVVQAWAALAREDWPAAVDFTERCIRHYGRTARKVQQRLEAEPNAVFDGVGRQALDDVATAQFIQAEAYRNSDDHARARKAYAEIIKQYGQGQCWDPRGWFWRPADVAAEKLAMYDSGVFLDFGDHSSEHLLEQAWAALERADLPAALGYTQKCIDLYAVQAQVMQSELKALPEDDDIIFAQWALNDVATAHFIRGLVYRQNEQPEMALREFEIIQDRYPLGQCWDPKGWFWTPADAAAAHIKSLQRLLTAANSAAPSGEGAGTAEDMK